MANVLSTMIRGILEEFRQLYIVIFSNPDPVARLEAQLRTLYGRGEVSRERYLQLRYQLHWGMLSKIDLDVIHLNALRLGESKGTYALSKADPSLERGLDRLYSDQVWVEEARSQLKDSHEALQNQVDWIKAQAEVARQEAAQALPDEAAARRSLEVWQKLDSLSQSLEADLQTMQTNLQKLDALDVEIRASIVRIKFSDSHEQLASMDLQVINDLIDHR